MSSILVDLFQEKSSPERGSSSEDRRLGGLRRVSVPASGRTDGSDMGAAEPVDHDDG